MDTETNETTPAYEAPRIEDHGDLVELTASTGTFGSFDASFQQGQPIPPEFGSSTTP